MQTDAELLRQYIEEGSESAFGELVRCYMGLVYSAAVRQAGGNLSLAEDVTQTVFIILARRGPSLVGHETLVGWLHTCTRYTTLRVLRDSRRRHDRELKATAMQINDAPKTCWDEVRPLLDEAVGNLNAADRQAVLLRFFQGRSHREVGATLGVTEDAARVRVDRALEKLRRHFERRGIIATGALLGEAILANAAEAEPAGLASRVSAVSATETATLGWSALMLRLVLMSTKQKILVAAAFFLATCLLSLSWFNWIGPRTQDKSLPQALSPNLAVAPRETQAETRLPPLAIVSVSAAEAVTTVSTPSDTASMVQPQPEVAASAPPPPPPPPAPLPAVDPAVARENFWNAHLPLFQKLNLSEEQQELFLEIVDYQQTQPMRIVSDAMRSFSSEQWREFNMNTSSQFAKNDPSLRDPWMFVTAMNNKRIDQLGLRAQVQAINDEANAQLRQLLGSEENFQAYQAYVQQDGVRQWVNHAYGMALQSAGVPELTMDQQEALVEIVANSLQPGDPVWRLAYVQPVVDQAWTILSPEQIEVLRTNPQGMGLSYYRLHREL